MLQRSKRRSKHLLALALLCAACFVSRAQSNEALRLSEKDFLQQLLLYHPALVTEELEVERAKARVQVARAAFDPVFTSDWTAKNFDDKAYYDYQQTSFSWQAPPGIRFRAGAERNRGDFVNPEFSTPAEGLAFAEVAIPLGEGLLRTADLTRLQKARVEADQAVSRLDLTSRNLALAGADLYWNWLTAGRELDLRQEITSLTERRYEQILLRFRQGLATGMDTLEAYTQYIQRQSEQVAAENILEEWFRAAGTMLWDENLYREHRQMRLSPDTGLAESTVINQLAARSPLINPILEVVALELKNARLDRLLAIERLKPDLYFKAKAISLQGTYALSQNSAVFGFSAYLPLISRRERAELKMANLRIEQVEAGISLQERELIQRYEQFTRQLILIEQQYRLEFENMNNAFELLRMENRLLLFGESTLIMVNLRETNYITSRLRLLDILRRKRMLQWRLAMLTHSPEELLFN